MKVGIRLFYMVLFMIAYIGSSSAQSDNDVYKVSYLRSSNGKTMPNQDPILVYTSTKETLLLIERMMLIINWRNLEKTEYP